MSSSDRMISVPAAAARSCIASGSSVTTYAAPVPGCTGHGSSGSSRAEPSMIPPPGGQVSWAWSTRSSSPYTTVSSKPSTSTRNRIKARASRARSVGQTWGGGALSVIPRAWFIGLRYGLDISELLGVPPGGRAAGEGVELAYQVGLVVVAAVGGEPRQAVGRAALQQAAGAVEPDHPGGRLRRQPDLGTEPARQLTVAPSDVRRESGDRHRASGAQQAPPSLDHLRRRLPRRFAGLGTVSQ